MSTIDNTEQTYKAARHDAICDCIAAVEALPEPWPIAVPHALPKFNVLAALRALLVKGLKNSAETTDGAE